MKNLHLFAIGSMVLATILTGTTVATTLTFGNTSGVPANNTDLAADYGSNVAGTPADTAAGFVTTDGTGATPNIALTWAPAGGPPVDNEPNANVWEYHSSITFTNPAGPAFTAPVMQMDVDLSQHTEPPADPTIDFTVTGGVAFRLNTFQIGNATDQFESPYRWIISLIRLSDMAVVNTQTTGLLGPGNKETVTFNYTGDPDEDYRLLFDDEGANAVRTAIDNLSFSQVSSAIQGDYNGNGVVDAADYALWRNSLGQSGAGLPADGDGNGTVQQADYAFWRARFGNSSGSGSAVAYSAVPEPAALGMASVPLICMATIARRRFRKLSPATKYTSGKTWAVGRTILSVTRLADGQDGPSLQNYEFQVSA